MDILWSKRKEIGIPELLIGKQPTKQIGEVSLYHVQRPFLKRGITVAVISACIPILQPGIGLWFPRDQNLRYYDFPLPQSAVDSKISGEWAGNSTLVAANIKRIPFSSNHCLRCGTHQLISLLFPLPLGLIWLWAACFYRSAGFYYLLRRLNLSDGVATLGIAFWIAASGFSHIAAGHFTWVCASAAALAVGFQLF